MQIVCLEDSLDLSTNVADLLAGDPELHLLAVHLGAEELLRAERNEIALLGMN